MKKYKTVFHKFLGISEPEESEKKDLNFLKEIRFSGNSHKRRVESRKARRLFERAGFIVKKGKNSALIIFYN